MRPAAPDGRGASRPRSAARAEGTSVRLDVFLNKVRLLKSRTLAKEACDRGKVAVNGEPVKAARDIRPGDRVRIDLGTRVLEVEVVAVPPLQVSRKDARDHYRLLADGPPQGQGREE